MLPVLRCPSVCQEDALIIQMVDELGLGKWSVIASHLPGRIGKQCRERSAPEPSKQGEQSSSRTHRYAGLC